MHEQNKLIVISGCSGGGKTTLITELSKMGYTVFPEVATEILREQLAIKGDITPWQYPKAFCKLLIERSITDFNKAKTMVDVLGKVIFFDRSYLEGMRYHKIINSIDRDKYDNFIRPLGNLAVEHQRQGVSEHLTSTVAFPQRSLNDWRYFDTVYIAPPWEEIYCQNEERKHSFQTSVADYEKILSFYHQCGYKTIVLPKVNVSDRVQFMLSSILHLETPVF